jgi:hypothetical protein
MPSRAQKDVSLFKFFGLFCEDISLPLLFASPTEVTGEALKLGG